MIINPYRYAAAGGGGLTDPNDVTGLVVWLDADAITGLSDTDPVSSWSNLTSGSSETFDQINAGAQPVYRTGIQNGLPVVRFSGDILTGSVSRTLKPVTVFLACSFSSITPDDYIVASSGSGAFSVTASGTTDFRLTSTGTGYLGTASTALATSTPMQLDVSFASGGAILFGRDGADDGSTSSGSSLNASTVTVGAWASGSGPFAGDIYEVIIYDNVLSTSDRQDVRDYLTSKWGI